MSETSNLPEPVRTFIKKHALKITAVVVATPLIGAYYFGKSRGAVTVEMNILDKTGELIHKFAPMK